MAKLKYHPQLILLWVASNYLQDYEFKKLLDQLPQRNSNKIFLRKFCAHFDIERLRTKPVIWQDVWIYNYLTYDCKDKPFPKTDLICNYENQIVIPGEKAMRDLMIWFDKQTLK
jgi:hypothetical protein